MDSSSGTDESTDNEIDDLKASYSSKLNGHIQQQQLNQSQLTKSATKFKPLDSGSQG
jgi:hypothetical protein